LPNKTYGSFLIRHTSYVLLGNKAVPGTAPEPENGSGVMSGTKLKESKTQDIGIKGTLYIPT
jgi:hypothetical protein